MNGLTAGCWTSAYVNTNPVTDYNKFPVTDAVFSNPYFLPLMIVSQRIGYPPGNPFSYPSMAAAAAAAYIKIFHGLGSGGSVSDFQILAATGEYAFGGQITPYDAATEALNSGQQTVATISGNAAAAGASANLLGYAGGDEPQCSGAAWPGYDTLNTPPQYFSKIDMTAVPAVTAGLNNLDPTRMVLYNETGWMASWPAYSDKIVQPVPGMPWLLSGYNCLTASLAALQSGNVAMQDANPLTNPYLQSNSISNLTFGGGRSDFVSKPNDMLWWNGLLAQSLAAVAAPGQPTWNWIEGGGDTLGFSSGRNQFRGGVSAGSTNLSNFSHWSVFTPTWIGLKVSGPDIPAGTRIVGISSYNQAVMSAPAIRTNFSENVLVTGGTANPMGPCNLATNLCVTQGNEFRPRPFEVNAEAWSTIIAGGTGVGYFCHDLAAHADNFCLGGTGVGASQHDKDAAAASFLNIQYINMNLLAFAPVINTATVGACSMQQLIYNQPTTVLANPPTHTSCTGGLLTMNTSSIPGMGMVKQLGGVTYLFAQSDRRSAAGGQFRFTLSGLGGQTAMVVYDSNTRYDPGHTRLGAAMILDASGAFTDILGANGDDYQVRIYAIS